MWDLHFLENEQKKMVGLDSSRVCADYCKDLGYQKLPATLLVKSTLSAF